MLAVIAGPNFSRSVRRLLWSASGQVSLPDAESGSSRSGSSRGVR